MATQEIPSGKPRSSAYIKIAEKNGSRLLPGRSILSMQILYQASFKFSPSLCLKLRTSFSGDKGVNKGLAIMMTQAKKRRTEKRGRIKRQGWSGGEENKRQMANNVMWGIRVCDGYLVCLDLSEDLPDNGARNPSCYVLSLCWFSLKRKGWCNTVA